MIPRRLDKFLRDSTARRVHEVRAAIAAGRVRMHSRGEQLSSPPADRLVFSDDEVLLDGIPVAPLDHHVTIAFHKPPAVTTTLSDPRGKRDLSTWHRKMPPGVFPVGRLDRDTTGLLLFTTDGDLASAVTRPDHDTDKTYWLWLNETLAPDDPRLRQLVQGVALSDGLAHARRVTLERAHSDFTELCLVLHEGRNRQIRRMCRALDLRLLHLHRRAVGPIEIADLAPGEFRPLSDEEIERLWAEVGGRAFLRQRKIAALERYARRIRQQGRPHARLERWLEDIKRLRSSANGDSFSSHRTGPWS